LKQRKKAHQQNKQKLPLQCTGESTKATAAQAAAASKILQ